MKAASTYPRCMLRSFTKESLLVAPKTFKRVTDFASSALFLWVSSNTKLNRRGSIMVYEVKGSEVHT